LQVIRQENISDWLRQHNPQLVTELRAVGRTPGAQRTRGMGFSVALSEKIGVFCANSEHAVPRAPRAP
jgi:hypothetical protein